MALEHDRARSARKWATGAAATALMAAFVGTAHAQDAKAAEDARIQALEAQIEALSQQVQDLKASTASSIKDIRTSAADTTLTLSNGRPTIAKGDGSAKFAIRGVAQFDAARYFEDDDGPLDLNSGGNFRRARLGFEGTVFSDWNYALTGEFGGSASESTVLNQAYIEYAGFKPFGLSNPLRIRTGAWAQAAGLEDATNNTESLFLERAASAEIIRGFAGGDGRLGLGVQTNGDRWFASATATGAIIGNTGEFDEQSGYLARVALLPVLTPNLAVHVGANVTGILDPADTGSGNTQTKNVQLRERPELRVDGTRLIDTGSIPSDGLNAYGLEFGASYKQFYVTTEGFKIDVSRTNAGGDPSFSGWYVQGAWVLTGEHRDWNNAAGGFKGIKPAKPFKPGADQWGAWEVAARYSTLNLNDNEGSAGSATPLGGVRGGEQDITTIGLNWYPNSVIRFLLDYQWAEVDRLNGAGVKIGEDLQAVSLRSQFAF